MDINLHHAQTYTLYAAERLSSVAWAAELTGGHDFHSQYLKDARAQLALAVEEIDAYEAKLNTKATAA